MSHETLFVVCRSTAGERERERGERKSEREKVVTFHYHQLGSLRKEFFSHAMNFCLIKMVSEQQQHVSSLFVV